MKRDLLRPYALAGVDRIAELPSRGLSGRPVPALAVNAAPAWRRLAATARAERGSRLAYFALCCYLISQAYMVPVLPFGPSWAVWPTLADMSVALMAVSVFYRGFLSDNHRNVIKGLVLVIIVISISYLGQTVLMGLLGVRDMDNNNGIIFGGFQLYRILQFAFIFWASGRVPMTPARLNTLRIIVMCVFLFVCITIALTFQSTVPTAIFAPQIPDDVKVGGPWSKFYLNNYEKDGLGTIGYDHSYPASQVLLLLGLHIHLCLGKRRTLNSFLMLLALGVIFITGSRTVLAGALVFALVMMLEDPRYAVVALIVVVLGISAISLGELGGTGMSDRILERQAALLNPAESGFSGRDTRWELHLNNLNKSPVNWIIGSGFGATFEFGVHAHMNYLQVISETGYIGFITAAIFAYIVLSTLWKVDVAKHPIFWVTIALLVTAFTEETFYPIAHKTHFIGFYLCSLAITLRRTSRGSLIGTPAHVESEVKCPSSRERSRSGRH
jgi:hypothetical protein